MVVLLRCVLCSTGTSLRVHLRANIDAEKFVEGGEMNLDSNTVLLVLLAAFGFGVFVGWVL